MRAAMGQTLLTLSQLLVGKSPEDITADMLTAWCEMAEREGIEAKDVPLVAQELCRGDSPRFPAWTEFRAAYWRIRERRSCLIVDPVEVLEDGVWKITSRRFAEGREFRELSGSGPALPVPKEARDRAKKRLDSLEKKPAKRSGGRQLSKPKDRPDLSDEDRAALIQRQIAEARGGAA